MGVYIMSNSQKFTDEQIEIIEKTFKKFYPNIQRAAYLVKLTKESLVNVHGEFNKNITPDEVEETLSMANELLTPVQNLLSELSLNGGFLLWPHNLEDINMKVEVTK
jgi:hypothetical protein